MEKIAVYTCITGDYDNLQEVKVKEQGIDYICFTNNETIKSKTWNVIFLEEQQLSNHYLSRKIKMLGHPFLEKNYTLSIWIDASVIFKESVYQLLEKYFDFKEDLFAACRHHTRCSIKEEAMECIKYRKDNEKIINNQLQFYQQEKFPDTLGLFEMTMFIKRHRHPLVKKTMNLWFNMIQKYSKRDQLSFMYCLFKTGLQVKTIDINVWNNDYLTYIPHKAMPLDYSYQVYYGLDHQFHEENSEINLYCHSNSNIVIAFVLEKDVSSLRIDICNKIGVVFKIISLEGFDNEVMKFQNICCLDDCYLTTNDDPQIIIDKSFSKGYKIGMVLNLQEIDASTSVAIIQKENIRHKNDQKKLSVLMKEIEALRTEIVSLKTSRSWKVTAPLRKVSSKLNKK